LCLVGVFIFFIDNEAFFTYGKEFVTEVEVVDLGDVYLGLRVFILDIY